MILLSSFKYLGAGFPQGNYGTITALQCQSNEIPQSIPPSSLSPPLFLLPTEDFYFIVGCVSGVPKLIKFRRSFKPFKRKCSFEI